MNDNKENVGSRNVGDCNAGSWNVGDCNVGDWNAGDWNAGSWNVGDCNIGNCNSGNCNIGSRNAGNWNAGDWNAGNCNIGYCNSITPEDILIFNKPAKRSDWDNCKKPYWMFVMLTSWVDEKDMTEKEKIAYPSYITTGGYLKHYASLTHAYIEAWEKATPEDRALTEKLPNFDKAVFAEVFGFNPFN